MLQLPTTSRQRIRTGTAQIPKTMMMMLLGLTAPVVWLASHRFLDPHSATISIVHAYPMTPMTSVPVSSPQHLARHQLRLHREDVDADVVGDVSNAIDTNTIHQVYSANPMTRKTTTTATTMTTSSGAIRRDWVDKSIRYYSTVMREERRKQLGQITQPQDAATEVAAQMEFERLAYQHYFALRKVKDGKPHHGERIYRRIINELQQEVAVGDSVEGGEPQQQPPPPHCDHAKFAIATLLLALHMQRTNQSVKATRSVFLNFFRTVVAASQTNHQHDDDGEDHQCACSAKVLQAFALFEMKQGNELKSLEIVLHAIRYDPSLNTILKWKQFRDVQARKQQRTTSRAAP